MNICISGRMAVGKSHVRKHIEAQGFKPVSLAAPLKQLADIAINGKPHDALFLLEDLTQDHYYASQMYAEWYELCFCWVEELEGGNKPRHFLQELGTAMRSHPGYDTIFIDYLLRSCRDGNHVCDDLRYKNEAHAFRKDGWLLVRCDCPDDMRHERCIRLYGKFGEEQNHPTEVDLNDWTDWDYMIDTSCPIGQQGKFVDVMMKRLYCLEAGRTGHHAQ